MRVTISGLPLKNQGSSGILVADSRRHQVELSTVEEDTCAIVFKSTESPCLGLDRLDAAVEAFAHGIGNAVAKVSQGIFEVSLEHLGYLDDRFELAARGPAIPAIEKLSGVARITIFPKPTKLLLNGPGPRGF